MRDPAFLAADPEAWRIIVQDLLLLASRPVLTALIGGPTLDKLAALKGFPPDVDDFAVLGSFYGEPARMVKCETVDLEVPANAEIVLECELMAMEGWTHDEAPFGEFTGMYGGGLKHNVRAVVKAMTFRRGGIFQYATIGGAIPGSPTTCCSCRPSRPTSSARSRTPLWTCSRCGRRPRG